jgi:hypothetical protein
MYNDKSSLTLTNGTISGNISENSANTGIGYGGGIYNTTNSSLTLTNVTISGNYADIGGGIVNTFSSLTLTNVTISGNYADLAGGIGNQESSPIFYNTIIWGNNTGVVNQGSGTITYNYSLVKGENPGGTNLDGTLATTDPLFVDAKLASAAPTTAGDYSLQICSPCLNVGNNAANSTLTDLAGNPRVFSGIIDLGAYENQSPPPAIVVTATRR